MSYDRYLQSETNAWLARQDELQEQWEETEAEIIEAIKNGKTIRYGRHNDYTIDPADSDLYDKVGQIQKQLMLAYVNGDDKELLCLIKQACNKEIIALIDIIGD